ncbi:hypothetical protein [uncultured Gimesia sp.]|uniref:hypothetical protein n=1 Tax=uncultured Gimesia sp. TaxID=1678688 RepID=UPI0030D842E4|tara:strand:+ start:1732 stop:2124 length:393 start_codon:yes stop_codon:yes gene_type:complete
MAAVSIFVWWIIWLAVVPLYLVEGRTGVKRGSGNDTHLKSHEDSVMSHEMSLKGCEVDRCDREYSEAVAAILRKCVSTQRLLWCEYQQAAACLAVLILFARARDAIFGIGAALSRSVQIPQNGAQRGAFK